MGASASENLLVGEGRGQVQDQGRQEGDSGNGVEVSAVFAGRGGDQIGARRDLRQGNVGVLHGDHLGLGGRANKGRGAHCRELIESSDR